MILVNDLLLMLKTKMQNRITRDYTDAFLLSELNDAIYKVAERRWVEVEDLEDRYKYDVINIALYNIALIGGDFQISHSENGISRSFIREEDILKKITPKGRYF
jgi:hypothetical protein